MEDVLSADTQMILSAATNLTNNGLKSDALVEQATKAAENAIRLRSRQSIDNSDWAVGVLREITSLYIREKIAPRRKIGSAHD